MSLTKFTRPIAIEGKAARSGRIAGVASVFNAPDDYGDVIQRGAFADSVQAFANQERSIAMLWSHDPARPIGRWVSVQETGRGLTVEGQVNTSTDAGRDALSHLAAGDVTGLSIGFIAKGFAYADDGHRVLNEIDLREVSVVAMPAQPGARLTEVRSPVALERALHGLGLPRAAAKLVVKGGWPALAGSPTDDEIADLLREIRSAARLFETDEHAAKRRRPRRAD